MLGLWSQECYLIVKSRKMRVFGAKKGAEAPFCVYLMSFATNTRTVGAITKQKPNNAIPIITDKQAIGSRRSFLTSSSSSSCVIRKY